MAYKNSEDAKIYAKQHYEENKELYKSRATDSRKRIKLRNRLYVQSVKENTPCLDCGLKYHYCQMDFDHIEDNKLNNVARLANTVTTLKRIQQEIDKCELVCSNCHRLRTWTRLQ